MKKVNKGLAGVPAILIVSAIFGTTFAPLVLAQPTADNFGVADNSGDQGTYILVPVNITNARDGPIICVIFNILYNNSIINLVEVHKGDLTSDWDTPSYWGTRISILYDGVTAHAIQNGSNGSVVVLNFSVIGEPLETSRMNLADIQLSDTEYKIGTAPAKNGTFTILTEPGPSLTPTPIEPPAGGGGEGGGGRAIVPGDTDAVVSTPTPMPTITPPVTPISPPITPPPTPIPSPSPTPTLRPPGFDAIFAIAGLAVAYLVLRRRKT